MKKTIKKLGLIATAMIIAFAFIACQGPAGPAGADGVDGLDGDPGILGGQGVPGEPGYIPPYNPVTITFDSDGGSAIPQQSMSNGSWARKPEIIPSKPIPGFSLAGEPEGLYRNHYQFDGWFLEDELYNFDTPVSESITLKARWSNPSVSLDQVEGDNILVQAVNYINTYVGEYILLLASDVTASNLRMDVPNVKLTLIGSASTRTMTLGGDVRSENLFNLSALNTSLTLDNNIILKGKAINSGVAQSSGSLIQITNGELIMKTGSRIQDHVSSFQYSAVYCTGASSSFIMEGGTITNNESTYNNANASAVGILIGAHGIMTGGTISGNKASGLSGVAPDFRFNGGSLTLSGDATIGELTLIQTPSKNAEDISVTIAGNFNSGAGIGKLHLAATTSNAVDTAAVQNIWVGKSVIKAAPDYTLPSTLVGNGCIFGSLGSFFYNGGIAAIVGYRLVLENGEGVLRAN